MKTIFSIHRHHKAPNEKDKCISNGIHADAHFWLLVDCTDVRHANKLRGTYLLVD